MENSKYLALFWKYGENSEKSKFRFFNSNSKKVRLTTIYSNITIFDNKHILLERDNKVGLYSI